MVEVEDFGAFESSFLDSMLEVEMTEEDGEVKISQSEDSLTCNERDLPPIPRFDLHTQTLTYEDPAPTPKQTHVLRPVAAQIPGTSTSVPAVKSAPKLPTHVLHPDWLKANNVTKKPNTTGKPVQILSPPPSSLLKSILSKSGMVSELSSKFLLEVFRPEFVKKVFKKQENHPDVSVVGEEEEKFYKSAFGDVSKVQLCKLHCTICDKHIGCGKGIEKKICTHNMLKVLTCKLCSEFYGDGNFPCDDGDHCEIYCRWCGQGGALICCSFCPKVFCKRCVRLNYTQSYLRSVEKASDWACFVCAQKPLWPHRAVCRALMEYINCRKTDNRLPIKDTTTCCKRELVKKKFPLEVDKDKMILSWNKSLQLNSKNHGNSAPVERMNLVSSQIMKPVTGNGPLIVKNFSTALKVNSQTKSPVAVMNKPNIVAITPKITSNSTPSKNILSKPFNSVPAIKSISGVNIPSVINAPIYHGQTLITPPRINSAQRKPPTIQTKEPHQSSVKISVADCVNVDINKIPVAKIPPCFQGVILRLNFPDNKVQLVRLVREGGMIEETTNFPIPKFENSENLDFLEGSLEDSFKLTKMLFERLMKIKEKLNSKTKLTKESIYKSSVKKLSFIYEKARELMKELDDNLLGNYEIWKHERDQDNDVSIIDLSDDEMNFLGKQNTSIFARKAKIFGQDDDSDIEVLTTTKKHTRTPERPLRSNAKNKTPKTPKTPRFGGHPPEHIDLNSFRKRRKNPVGRPRKKPKLAEDEDVIEITEKDPLAVSDTEEDILTKNGLEHERSVLVVKKEKACAL